MGNSGHDDGLRRVEWHVAWRNFDLSHLLPCVKDFGRSQKLHTFHLKYEYKSPLLVECPVTLFILGLPAVTHRWPIPSESFPTIMA